MDNIERAMLYHDQGYACSQAVLLAFAEELGLDKETAVRISACFGGGMGRTGRTCGAVSGALMVAGLAQASLQADIRVSKETAYVRGRQVLETFQSNFGSLNCCDLVGEDISTPEGLARAREQKLFAGCTRYIQGAVEIVANLI